jgi:hypothetical protein
MMGFLDKVKAQAESAVKQGQDKLDEQKAKKKADGLLRDLGAWYYASQTDRDDGKGEAELARIVAELQAHEAEHGPLGGGHDGEPDEPEQPTTDPGSPRPAEVPGEPGPQIPPPPGPGTPPPPPGPGTPPPPPGPGEPPPPPVIPPPPPSPLPPMEVPPMPAQPPTGIPPMQAGDVAPPPA